MRIHSLTYSRWNMNVIIQHRIYIMYYQTQTTRQYIVYTYTHTYQGTIYKNCIHALTKENPHILIATRQLNSAQLAMTQLRQQLSTRHTTKKLVDVEMLSVCDGEEARSRYNTTFGDRRPFIHIYTCDAHRLIGVHVRLRIYLHHAPTAHSENADAAKITPTTTITSAERNLIA